MKKNVNRRFDSAVAKKTPKTTTLRLESLESRELLSVAPGSELLAANDANLCGYMSAAFESSDPDVLDLSAALLDDAADAANSEHIPTEGATTIVVTSAADVVDASDGVTTLREALLSAENGDLITFASSLKGKTITLNSDLGQLTLERAITIDASNLWNTTKSEPGLTISGGGATRILEVCADTRPPGLRPEGGDSLTLDMVYFHAEIKGITFANGYVSDDNCGGAIYHGGGCSLSLNNCVIRDNEAYNGGGLHANTSAITLVNCTVSNNIARNQGGGIWSANTTSSITNSEVSENQASSGGGLYIYRNTTTLANSAIRRNEAKSGGGVYSQFGVATLTNCAVTSNSVTDNGVGGGLYLLGGSATLYNCTVARNASRSNGGVYLCYFNDYYPADLTAYNSIIAGNIAGDVDRTRTAQVKGYNTLSSFTGWDDGSNNLTYDESLPLFTNGNRLAENSQAIDQGDAQYVSTSVDFAGDSRIVGEGVDLGAYEYQFENEPEPRSIIVTSATDVVDAGDGVVTLREAFSSAEFGDRITFASSLKGATIALDSELGQLSTGKSLSIDATNLWDAENDAPGITISGEGATRILKLEQGADVAVTGVTFANGYVNGTDIGGAIYNYNGTLSLENCVIRDNEAYYGGGVYSEYGVTTLANCTVLNNTASSNGGGVYQTNGALSLSNCTVANNTSNSNGGGIYQSHGALTMENSAIRRNEAKSGGGVYSQFGVATLTNCAVTSNSVTDDGVGGGLYLLGGSATLYNCTVARNASRSNGGVYLCYFNDYNVAVLTAYNSIIAGNIASDVDCSRSSAQVKGYNTLSSFTGWDDGSNNLTYDESLPLFTNAEVDDYTLAANSQAIDKGDNQYVSQGDVDLAGKPRISGETETVDLGAYEFQVNDGPIQLDAPELVLATKSDTTITVSWNAIPNATRYSLSYRLTGTTDWTNKNVGKVTSYTVSGLTSNTSYEFRLKAVGDEVNYKSVYSAVLRVKTDVDLPPLAVPTNTTETAKTETTITVAWDAVENASGYRLAWKNQNDSDYSYVPLDVSTTSKKFTGLDNSATYEWTVQALAAGICYTDSEYTATRTAIPRQKLAAPANLSAAPASTSITVSWDAVSGASRYYVSYKLSSASDWSSNINAGTGLSYTISGLESDTEYDVRVKTIGDNFDYASSNYSTTIVTTLPDGPIPLDAPELVLAAKSDTTITVSWDAIPNATRYSLSYRLTGTSSWTNKNVGKVTNYTVTGLTPDRQYDFRLKAVGDEVNYKSVYSPLLRVATQPDVVEPRSTVVTTELDVVDVCDGLISLREALDYAESGATITFVDALKGKTIALDSELGRLTVDKSVTIDASSLWDATTSAPGLTISGQGATRILLVDNGSYDEAEALNFIVEIDGITFTNGYNAYDDESGAAITADFATLSLNNCVIRDNEGAYGATIWNYVGTYSFVNCTISDNSRIGAVFEECDMTLVNCAVTNNVGGAIDAWGGTFLLDSCVISDNANGGYNFSYGETTLVNCLVSGNSGGYYGGLVLGGVATLYNCTVTGNMAEYGGGVRLQTSAVLNAYNTIIVNNNATNEDGGDDVYIESYDPNNLPLANAYNTLSSYSNWTSGANNLTYDASKPLFANAASGDYTLATNSQAINKGDNQYVQNASTSVDLAGNPRLFDGTVDLGAYESPTKPGPEPLSKPVLSLATKTETTITVSWDAVPNASRYSLSYRLTGTTAWTNKNVGKNLNYTISELEPNTEYDFRLKAVGDEVNYKSVYSAILRIKTDVNLPPLDSPTNPTETAKTETTITVAWDAVANATGYKIAWKKTTDSEYGAPISLNASTTSKKLTNLDNGALYEWKVFAVGDGSAYGDSAYTEARTARPRQKLDPPTLSGDPGTTSITVSWDAVTGATRYYLSYKLASATDWSGNINAGTNTSRTISGLVEDATYEIRIKSIGDNFDYSTSDYASVTVRTKKLIKVPLDPPVPFVAAKTATTITASWDAVPNASGYRFLWKNQSEASFHDPVILSASKTSYKLTGLDNSAIYVWKVLAIGDNVSYLNSAYCATQRDKPQQTLATPTNTRETAKTDTTVTVAWNAVPNASGYKIAWRNKADSANDYITLGAVTSYEFTGLDSSAFYYWKVQVLGDGVDYAASAYTTARMIRPIQKLATPSLSVSAERTSITVSWTAVANATGYSVSYKLANAADWTNVDVGTNLSHPIDGLAPNTQYNVCVKALGDGFDYADSDDATRTVKTLDNPNPEQLSTPTNPRETAKTETTITVAWDAVPNANGYKIAWRNKADSANSYITLDASTTSYKFTRLDNDASYYWKVQALGDGANYTNSAYTAARTMRPRQKLPAPTLSADAGATSITLSWNAVPHALRYYVSYKLASATDWSSNINVGTNLGYTISGLTLDAQYDVRVKAIGDNFDYSSSDYATILVPNQETPSTVVTTNLDVVDSTDGLISLREAFDYANSGDTITFVNSLQGKTIALERRLETNKKLVIDASNLRDVATLAPGLTISGQGASRILYLSESSADVEISWIAFKNGYSIDEGGAIYAANAVLSLNNCVISDNEARGGGGGVYSVNGETTFANCTITRNISRSSGGGLNFFHGYQTLTNCTITNNACYDANSQGGGMWSTSYETTLINCLVVGNNAGGGGGGLGSYLKTNIYNCTITANTARDGGGVDISNYASNYTVIYNTVIVGNSASSHDDDVSVYGSCSAYNTLSNFTSWTNGANNLVYDNSKPLFTNAASGDYTLATNSQAINKGNNQYVATDVDLAGNARIVGGRVDIGAYEYQTTSSAVLDLGDEPFGEFFDELEEEEYDLLAENFDA